jgi:hypothetical protein
MMRWRAPILTLAALAAAWLAWIAAGPIVEAVTPGGAEMLLRALLVFAALGLLERLLSRLEEPPHA